MLIYIQYSTYTIIKHTTNINLKVTFNSQFKFLLQNKAKIGFWQYIKNPQTYSPLENDI